MPTLDPTLDVIITDDGLCTTCGAPSEAPYCPKCVKAMGAQAPERKRVLDKVTERLVEKPIDPVRAARQELAKRELARRHMVPFMKYVMPTYDAGWVHEDIALRLERFLQQVINGESPRLMLNMPPRHGKSLEVSQLFPAWALGHFPHLEFISTSHTLSLSQEFSRKARSTLEDKNYQVLFKDTQVDPENRNVAGWKTTKGGGYRPAGVGGSITGHGCHILIIDDYLKNKEEALSETTIEGLWNWYSSTAYTRLAPGGGVLIIATRWVTNDLSGKLLEMAKEEGGDQFELIVYPAIDDRPTYRLPDLSIVYEDQEGAELLRPAGEALHPARFPVERLMQIKNAIDPMDWEALYQQDPKMAGAGIFKEDEHIHYYDDDELPQRLMHYAAWDLAIGRKERNDYTVGLVGGVDADDTLWLVDHKRGRIESTEIVDSILDFHRTYKTQADGIEKSQVAQSIGPFLEKRIEEEKINDINIVDLPPGNRDKIARARAIQGRCRQGKVRIPRNAPWTKEFVAELLAFNGTSSDTLKDDQADAFSWLGVMLYEMDRPAAHEVTSGEPEWKRKILAKLATKRGRRDFMAG